MILYYANRDAHFELEADRYAMEHKHKIKIVDTTIFQVELCKSRKQLYQGPKTYMFIGDWTNIVNYFIWDYPLQDVEELQDLVKSIKTVEI